MVLSLGFAWFKHYPSELVKKLPVGSYTYTCDMVDFEFLRDKRVLIVGGRPSAFEWAALIREKGAEQIYVTHRHATPQFTEPDWSWVQPMVRRTLNDHGWWRRLTDEEKEKIRKDFWAVGRLTLEAWLGPRVDQPTIYIHQNTTIARARTLPDGTYELSLDDDTTVNVHHIILVTGYVPNMDSVAFLDRRTILQELQTLNGSPRLDTEFQTTVPNLYVSGLAAVQDFGPFLDSLSPVPSRRNHWGCSGPKLIVKSSRQPG